MADGRSYESKYCIGIRVRIVYNLQWIWRFHMPGRFSKTVCLTLYAAGAACEKTGASLDYCKFLDEEFDIICDRC